MEHLIDGFISFLSAKYILACFLGAGIGTLIGVLPGLGPATTMALMLPFTLSQGPMFGLIMLSGIFCGAMYGGSTTSILVNIPGEAGSVVTCIEGYEMAKKGRGGAALALVAGGSFIAGTISILLMHLFAPLLADAAIAFGPPEYFALMVFCFTVISNLSGDAPAKGFLMLAVGVFLSIVGICPLTSVPRFAFGSNDLMSGIEFLPVAVGMFGLAEIISLTARDYAPPEIKRVSLQDLYPSREEIKRAAKPILRGSVVGFFLGLIPGPSAVTATFISYAIEKKLSKKPQEFTHGAVEGVVGPESANNSAAVSSLIPLLTLGIPFNAVSAILLASLMMHNVIPGPLLFQNSPEIFWTLIAALYIGNIILLILNLPLVGAFSYLARLRPQILMPFVCIICLLGVYSVRSSIFDVWVMVFAGVVGVFFRKRNYPVAPLVIGLILGPMTENNFRKSLMMFEGNLSGFLNSPIALSLFCLTAAVMVYKVFSSWLRPKLVEQHSGNE